MKNGTLARAIGAAAMIAAVAACSSSSKKASTSSTTQPASSQSSSSSSAAAPTGAPITVGLICDCSGPFGADIAAAGEVGKAWANSVNASGGIDGHPIQLTELDDASNPGTSTTDAQQLIAKHVDVIIDDSNFDAVWSSTVSASHIPVVGGNFSTPAYYTDPDFFPSGQTNDSITYANVAVAKQAGATNIGDLYCAEAPQCQQSVPLIAAAGKAQGVPAVYNASIAATAPNYTAQCVAAQQQKVSALFIGDSAAIIARVAKDCTQQGYTPTYVTEGTGYSDQIAQTAGLKDHEWASFPDQPYFNTSSSGVQAMNAAVDKYYPGLRSNVNEWSEYALQTWTAGLLIEDAVKGSGIGTSGTPSAATMLQGLNSIKNDTLGGMSPPLTFSSPQHKVDCWFVARVQGGTPTLVNNGQLMCQNGSSSS